ncbi:TIGR04197 family type VII secretion effector [Enterococcus sp. LJL128]
MERMSNQPELVKEFVSTIASSLEYINETAAIELDYQTTVAASFSAQSSVEQLNEISKEINALITQDIKNLLNVSSELEKADQSIQTSVERTGIWQ